MSFRGFLLSLTFLTALILLTFLGLRMLHLSVGSLVDWLVGVGVLWWLMAVVVLPWDAHYAALDVVEQARVSRAEGIMVPAESVAFAERVARRFRLVAIGLHLATAGALLALAYYRVIAVGYPAAAAAFGLTFLRPAQRAYDHLAERLRNLGQQIRYPREDVVELRTRVDRLEEQLKEMQHSLDPDREDSAAAAQARSLVAVHQQLDRLDSQLTELTRQNAREHEGLVRQTTTEIARLSEDARFLNQVRELIRFVRQA